MISSTVRASSPRLALATLVALTLAACGGSGDSAASSAPPPKTYQVRGQVVTLPPDNGGEIRIAHEAIDDFVAADGAVVGMDAMTMSFPLTDEAAGVALAVGDAVEFDLRVDWSTEELALVTRLEKLPEGTEITFEAARPPSQDG